MRKLIILLLLLPTVLTACLVPPMQPSADSGPSGSQDQSDSVSDPPAPTSTPETVAVQPSGASAPPPEPDRPAYRSDLPDLGPAPEIANTVWINSDRPLRLAELEGKVVLIDMWTFG